MQKLLFLSAFFLLSLHLLAQQRTITGKIIDEKGNPIPSASITVKGSKKGTNADQNGNFSLPVPAAAKTLVFSSVGYGSQEVSIVGLNELSVQLTAEIKNDLQDVVVVGYGTQRKRDLTGAIYKLKDSTFQDIPIQGP